jgi:basic amino acid/polyamine antiporter, APA family
VAAIDPVRQTPAIAIVCYIGVALVLALSGGFAALALVAASGTLAMYLICCLGVLRLRANGVADTGTPFVIPGGPTVPLLASLGILALLASLERSELIGLAGVLAVCAIPCWVHRATRR